MENSVIATLRRDKGLGGAFAPAANGHTNFARD
jgi:hypothetical protein